MCIFSVGLPGRPAFDPRPPWTQVQETPGLQGTQILTPRRYGEIGRSRHDGNSPSMIAQDEPKQFQPRPICQDPTGFPKSTVAHVTDFAKSGVLRQAIRGRFAARLPIGTEIGAAAKTFDSRC